MTPTPHLTTYLPIKAVVRIALRRLYETIFRRPTVAVERHACVLLPSRDRYVVQLERRDYGLGAIRWIVLDGIEGDLHEEGFGEAATADRYYDLALDATLAKVGLSWPPDRRSR